MGIVVPLVFATPDILVSAVNLVEVLLVALRGSLDCGLTRVPVGRADLAVLVGELESVDDAESLVYGAADRKVVDGDLFMSEHSEIP